MSDIKDPTLRAGIAEELSKILDVPVDPGSPEKNYFSFVVKNSSGGEKIAEILEAQGLRLADDFSVGREDLQKGHYTINLAGHLFEEGSKDSTIEKIRKAAPEIKNVFKEVIQENLERDRKAALDGLGRILEEVEKNFKDAPEAGAVLLDEMTDAIERTQENFLSKRKGHQIR